MKVVRVTTGRVGMAGNNDEPSRLGLDTDQRLDQHLGRLGPELSAAGAEQRQAFQAHGSGAADRHECGGRLTMARYCRLQRSSQQAPLVQPQAERPRFTMAVVGIQALCILEQGAHCRLALRKIVRVRP
ncbi:hypothetical protein D3C80_1579430 [compost metagenome]